MFRVLWGRCFISGALFPSKSGLIHKNTVKVGVKHIEMAGLCDTLRRVSVALGGRVDPLEDGAGRRPHRGRKDTTKPG
jgi:hypothetical protein